LVEMSLAEALHRLKERLLRSRERHDARAAE
jgi:hypothetical protein